MVCCCWAVVGARGGEGGGVQASKVTGDWRMIGVR